MIAANGFIRAVAGGARPKETSLTIMVTAVRLEVKRLWQCEKTDEMT
jgi:hypothetical protein